MPLPSMKRSPLRLRALVAPATAVVAVGALVAGCGGSGSKSSSSSSAPKPAAAPVAPSPDVDTAAAAKVPQALRNDGTLHVAMDASYAPNEFLDSDGHSVVGMDADLAKAIAVKLGLKADVQNVQFDSIIPGLTSGKYTLGMSSFTDTKAREGTVDFVTYFSAGSSLMVASGNPQHLAPGDLSLCGKNIAVEKGTTQESDDVPARAKACQQAGKPAPKGLSFDDQNGANLALSSGRADAVLADSPVNAYAVKQSNGRFVISGDTYGAAPYGIAIPKDAGTLKDAVQAAVQDLIQDGTYQQILNTWGIASGAITTPAIDAAQS